MMLASPWHFGSPTWTRTRDLRINSPSLYQLSYQGTDEGAIMNYFSVCGYLSATKNLNQFFSHCRTYTQYTASKTSGFSPARRPGEIEKAPHECKAICILWLPDLDSNQGPAD